MKSRFMRCGWRALSSPVPGTAIITGLFFILMVLLAITTGAVVNPPYNISVGDWLK